MHVCSRGGELLGFLFGFRGSSFLVLIVFSCIRGESIGALEGEIVCSFFPRESLSMSLVNITRYRAKAQIKLIRDKGSILEIAKECVGERSKIVESIEPRF